MRLPATAKQAGIIKNNMIIGQVQPDGSIYEGLSPKTGTNMYSMPEAEISQPMHWQEAIANGQNIKNAFGYNGSMIAVSADLKDPLKNDGGWHMGTISEMMKIISNRNDRNEAPVEKRRYWSLSEVFFNDAWTISSEHTNEDISIYSDHFNDPNSKLGIYQKHSKLDVLYIRTEPLAP